MLRAIKSRTQWAWFAIGPILALCLSVGSANADQISAIRVDQAPVIDGVLSEPIWAGTDGVDNFTQRRPNPGEPAKDPTRLQVVYTDDTVFIAIRLSDEKPDEIRGQLGRRDALPNADRVTVYLDPLRTGQRAYFFSVSAAGTVSDGVVFNQTDQDRSWDAIWSARTSRDSEGWTVEFAIPLTSIPFQDAKVQNWGFLVERFVNRTQELSSWPAVKPGSTIFVGLFGELRNLAGLARSSVIRVQPYTSARTVLSAPGGDDPLRETFVPNAGLNVRYTPTPLLRLVLALNPDFGEVDQDRATVNLSATEQFFAERRPFFATGLDLFSLPSPPSKLGTVSFLNTRRIGAANPNLSNRRLVIRQPQQRRVLSALKLLGEAGTKISYGAVSVLEEPATRIQVFDNIFVGPVLVREETSPLTHYSILRGRYRLGGRSYLGAIATGVNRIGETEAVVQPSGELKADTDAYTGALDLQLRGDDGALLRGFLAGSSNRAGSGIGGFLQAGRLGFRKWIYKAELEFYSKSFDLNDAGFCREPTISLWSREWTASVFARSGHYVLATLH